MEGFVIPVSRPGVDDALSTTERLFGGTPIAEGPGGFNTADTVPLPPFAPISPNLDPQLVFSPGFQENGTGSMSYASSLQPGPAANAAWLVNTDVTGLGTWIHNTSSFDSYQAPSPILSELGNTQTPGVGYNYHEFGAGDSHSSRPMISYEYNIFTNDSAEGAYDPGNNDQIPNLNWGSREQSSEATGLDSDAFYDPSVSQASVTDASTPVTNPDQPRRFRCDRCDRGFNLRKDRDRHEKTEKHRRNAGNLLEVPALVSAGKYTCRCGYRQARKDDYKRHLLTCKMKKQKYHKYACKCGHQLDSKDEHSQHISTCGRGRPGRPRNGTSR